MAARTRPEERNVDTLQTVLPGQSTLTSHELVGQTLLHLGVLLPLLVLLLGLLGPLLVEDGLLRVSQLGALLPPEGESKVSLVPDNSRYSL